MPWTAVDIPDQTGRVIVITGANSGLGLESTKALAAKGARVVMACRNQDKAQAAADEVRGAHPDADLDIRALDLASLDSVRAFADEVRTSYDRLDVLLNNAGIMAIPRRETADGFEMQLGTNHLGHFALTDALLPLLQATEGARIVNVSSMAHRMGRMDFDDLMGEQRYERWAAYGQSKLANLLFTYALARRLTPSDGQPVVAAAHPGYASTNLQHVGPRMDGSSLAESITQLGNALLGQSAVKGALPQLYAATAPSVEHGGYYGPDGFQEFWGHPKAVGSSKRARDEGAQERLWTRSVELTGADFGGL